MPGRFTESNRRTLGIEKFFILAWQVIAPALLIGPPDGSKPREVLKRPDWIDEIDRERLD